MIFQLQAKDSVVRIGGSSTADCLNGVQNMSWDAAMNSENEEQLGDSTYFAKTVQPSTSGSFEAKSSGSISAFLGRMIYQVNAGTGEFTGYMGSTNGNYIRENDLQFACFDLIEAQRNDQGIFDRSTLLPRAYLSQISMTANSDGTATEKFSFEGDVLEVYRTAFHDLISLAVTRDATLPATTVVVPAGYKVETSVTDAAADWKVYALDIDGTRVMASDLTVTPGATRGTTPDKLVLSAAVQTAGKSVTKGSKLAVIMYRKTPGSFPSIVNPTSARFVKADAVNIWLIDPTVTFTVGGNTRTVEAHLNAGTDFNLIPFADSDLLLRAQSVDITVDLKRDELKELKKNDRGTATFFRAAKYPLNVTASLNTIVSDLNDWAKIQGKDLYGADASPDILNLADFEGKTWVIVVRYYKSSTILQTVGILDAMVDGLGQNVSVGGRSERTWNFNGSKVAIKGNAAA